MPAAPFNYEWQVAEEGKGKSYNPVTRLEQWIPRVFIVVHLVLAIVIILTILGLVDLDKVTTITQGGQDVEAVSHEVGHFLSKMLTSSGVEWSPAVTGELDALGREPYDPDQLQRAAPEASRWLGEVLDTQTDVRDTLQSARNDLIYRKFNISFLRTSGTNQPRSAYMR